MELRPPGNFMVRHESSDSDNIGDGEIDEEFRHGELSAEKQISMKKRKGRPRKFNDAVDRRDPQSTPDSQTKPERRRGPRPGLSISQVLATLGCYAWETIGRDFIPQVVLVAPRENIVDRISNFKVPGRRSICIISAYGSVSSVIIHKPNTVASILRFEGIFEILQLSGWFDGRDNKKQMAISFSTSNGQVFGGIIVRSRLIAATPVQIIVGSFIIQN
ncbi:AT-hook motif nuclear-localized protein 7 [Cucumis sativus]|uniref:AT-hook motif nuclear-localized protein 7 n=1 Tax=Cucumis sativus TaxID=3659 RepID=UPI0012F4D133|nr:AT-hook motif nuclear-localized protein 7 [Cucumis sativus]XP_031743817.1 AT-hook motif nuclear-localized protein 7 [Cucumis sativus]KAE8646901.1 hypothetical protein Csa_020759 [Cucumis sativus]